MKNVKLVVVACLTLVSSLVFAQGNGVRMTGVQFQILGSMQQEGNYTLADYQSFAGSSALLNTNFYGYNKSTMGMAADIGFGAQGSFRFMKDGVATPNRKLRLGIAGGMSEVGNLNYDKSWHTTGDSIYNSTGAPIGYVDSLHTSSYNAHYRGNFFRVDGSMVWSTDEVKRFSFYTGAGLTLGTLFNAKTTVNHWENVNARYNYSDGTHSGNIGYSNHVRESESFASKGGFYSSIYLPIGLNLRLGKTNPFWSHASIYTEWRPSVVFQSYAGTGFKTLFGVSHTWGFRWEF